ncbi:MAG: HAMP domain-containing histidine kinase [Spirochaetaceae bacterium]
MTIGKRLRISYILLVLIPLIIFITLSITVSSGYTEQFKQLRLSIQSKDFNNELYNILGNDPDSLLENSVLQKLIQKTQNPSVVTAVVSVEGTVHTKEGFDSNNISKDFHEQKFVNYWLFNLKDGRSAEIHFMIKDFKVERYFLSFLIPFIFYSILISILTYFTARTITRPLQKLKDAAISIKEEEFDIDLTYNAKDEINEVFAAFDDMRLRLKNSAQKQLMYENNRTELIANISHDLKTPITAIKGYIEGIVDGVANTPEKINKYHETISKKVNILDKLIENLFLSSKLDLKTVHFNFQKLDLNLFITDIIDEILYDSPNLKINYTKNIDILLILADPIQLQRVIHNIIRNSVKYCDKEICLIDITLSQNQDMAMISIKDNGIGVNPKTIDQIFTRFYRADPARSSSTEGSGLGLAISRQIITEHKGAIFVRNNPNSGITVTFKLPLI